MRDFLVEIQTEELPPKTLKRLALSFLQEIETRLTKAELNFGETNFFATPRRLAVLIKKLPSKQPDSVIERKGPAMVAAFDNQGNPTSACLGFARSCGIEPANLITIKTEQGEWVGHHQTLMGKTIQALLPTIVEQALAALPIAKRMRWGSGVVEFARPVHSIMMLYGKEIIPANILNIPTDRKTRGHRFHSKGWVTISSPTTYLKQLEKKFVIADFTQRKEKIREQVQALIKNTFAEKARAVIHEDLLDEVTGLVEWPVAICGNFSKEFLTAPQEALISAMQDHQRYFPVVDQQGKLLPHFVTVSNIESKNRTHVIAGNERVLRARLSDANFFFITDKKEKLKDRLPALKNSIFQHKLGTLFDKAQRLAELTAAIAKQLAIDPVLAKEAGLLAKTDLTTQLVGEFPELQGVAGFHYALHEGYPETLAIALNEQYLPRFSGDTLPKTPLGCALAIADRLDTLLGVFAINQAPTGDKDPFGLRRAALGVLRILIENQLNLDLRDLLQAAQRGYADKLENKDAVDAVLNFTLERLKPWYQEQGITADVFAAVTTLNMTRPYDIHCRIQAVQAFKNLKEAEALSIANKRVSNILAKYPSEITVKEINPELFEEEAERALAKKITEQHDEIISLSRAEKYPEILAKLAELREPVDLFFDKVLVMVDDKARRENRLLLLKKLRELFLYVADIALLQ